MTSNRLAMIEAYQWKAFLYYALFPLDLYRDFWTLVYQAIDD